MTVAAFGGSKLIEKMTADIAITYATGEQGMGMYTGGRTCPTHDAIAKQKYLDETEGELRVGLIREDPSPFRNGGSASPENREAREVNETYDGPENAMFSASLTY